MSKTVDTPGGKVIRYDYTDPADLAAIIASGVVWKAGPQAKQDAVEAIVAGTVPMPTNLPPEVAEYVAQRMGR